MLQDESPERRDHEVDPDSVPRGVGAHRREIDRAGRWLDTELGGDPIPPLLVVIGLGHGYLLDVLEERAPETLVLALEPDAAAARVFQSRASCDHWILTDRLVYLIGPDFSGADNAWRLFPRRPDDFKLIVDQTTARRDPDGAVRAARAVKKIVFGARANADARQMFAPRYLRNTIRNAPAIVAGSDIRALTNVYRGVPAIIAAAGPSLDNAWDELRSVRDRGVLIACDTALRPLISHGIGPQLVVAVDPGERNTRHFQALGDCPETWLVAESAIDPSVACRFETRSFWFRVSEHHPWPWYREQGIDVGTIDVWGSVLTAAFQIATLAGCDPIVLVGADFSWSRGRPYARGTTYEFDWAYSTATGSSLEHAWASAASRTFLTPDLHGKESVTTPALQAFRDWMVTQAGQSNRRIINASGAGILSGEGVEQSSLSAALPERRSILSLETIARMRPSAVATSKLAARFRSVKRNVDAPPTTPLTQWAEFSGDGYQPIAIAAALEAAACELDDRGTADRVETMPWEKLTRRYATPAILNRLPEAVARLHSSLNGAERLPAFIADGTDQHSVGSTEAFAEALDLLGPICDALSSVTEGQAIPFLRWAPAHAPVSGLCAWPPEIQWPMQLFEAMLGARCVQPWPPPDDSFFARGVIPRDRDTSPPHGSPAAAACALLALEWVMCATTGDIWPSSVSKERVRALLQSLQAAIGSSRCSRSESWALEIVLGAEPGAKTRSVTAPVENESLARTLTGMVRVLNHGETQQSTVTTRTDAVRDTRVQVAQVCTPSVSASINVRLSGVTGSICPEPLLLTPRVLTDEGVSRSILGYTDSRGAVFASLHGHGSFVVQEDGAVKPRFTWPHTVSGELPLGAEGAVAWNNGTADWPARESGYVMHRRSADDEPVTVELPFRPTVGTWWHGRLYWTCFPSGVGSWAPGEDATFSLPDYTLLAIHPDESGLLLAPCLRNEDGAYLRRTMHRRMAMEAWGVTRRGVARLRRSCV